MNGNLFNHFNYPPVVSSSAGVIEELSFFTIWPISFRSNPALSALQIQKILFAQNIIHRLLNPAQTTSTTYILRSGALCVFFHHRT